MTREQTQTATRVSVVVAVVAAVVLAAALVVPALSTTGLWILLSVPLARNLAAAIVSDGADRAFACLGVVISACVVAFAVFAD